MSKPVYFIQCGDRVKIGESDDPVKRLSKVSSDAPFPCTLLGVCTRHVETDIHQRFAAHRLHGEWFHLAEELLTFIKNNTWLPTVERAALTPIAQRMKEKGFETDAALAAKVQCDRSMITRIKAGKVQPSLRIAVRLAKLLGLPPETFLNGDAA